MNNKTEKVILLSLGILIGVVIGLIFSLFTNLNQGISGNVILGDRIGWITEEDIKTRDSEIVINKENLTIFSYPSGKSMDPTIGEDTILIVSRDLSNKIKEGDIILYRSEGLLVVHRVISKSIDKAGIYYILQGDNNLIADGKIREEDIEGVVVGILY